MRKQYTRVYGLKTSTWKDITYVLLCLLIVVLLGTQATQKKDLIVSPIPQAQATNVFASIQTKTLPVAALPDTSWVTFSTEAKRLAPLYDFPISVMLSQAAIESARGQSVYAQTRNNYFGIAAYDWNPDNAYSFDNPGQSIIEYMRLIKTRFPTAYADRHTPDQMIRDMEDSVDGVVYATDPDYVSKIESQPEWSTN